MNKLTTLFAALALTLAACGDSGDSASKGSSSDYSNKTEVVEGYISEISKIADALESVTDKDSAEKAAKQIAKINAELDTITTAAEDMNQITFATAMAGKASDFQAAQIRISTAMQKLSQDHELMMILSEEINKTPKLDK